jgi:hypothetical protein
MSRCKDIQKELEAFLNDETDTKKACEIQDHLKECPTCSQVLKESTRLSEVLQNWELIEPPSDLYENLKTKIKSADSYHKKIILTPFVKKVTFEFAKIAAVVIITLLIGYWILYPLPDPVDDSTVINLYLKEHQSVVSQTVSANLTPSPDTRIEINRDDILYYEFFDKRPGYTRPGIIMRRPGSQQKVTTPDAPAIKNGQNLTLPEARKSVTFDLVSPQRFHPGYILDKIRKIEGRNSLQLIYTNGIKTISLFEQSLAGEQRLGARDFREYAVYQNQGQSGGTILAWSDKVISYVLIGNEEMSRLMDMAHSISARGGDKSYIKKYN